MALNCWFLWQRMPPRYQLTLRDVAADDEVDIPGRFSSESTSGARTPRSPRPRTPGARRCNVGSPRSKPAEVSVTLTPCQGSEDSPRHAEDGAGPTAVLPARHSAYVSNKKNLMRLNSGRRLLDEGLLTGPAPSVATAKCHRIFPFPVTRLANYCHGKEGRTSTAPGLECARRHVTSRQKGGLSSRSGNRPASGVSGYRSIAFRTVSPFSEVADCEVGLTRHAVGPSRDGVGPARHGLGTVGDGVVPYSHHRPAKQHVDVMGDVLPAASSVEREGAAFYRQPRVDTGQTLTCRATNPFVVSQDDASYLAHLRRLYVKGARDLAKTSEMAPADLDRRNTHKERVEYNRKVGRILEYYAHVELPLELRSQRRPGQEAESLSVNLQSTPGLGIARRQSRGLSDRAQVHLDAANVEEEGYVPWQKQGQDHSHEIVSQDKEQFCPRGSSDYVRINHQAKLHRRQFYLRTPARNSQFHVEAGMEEMARCPCAMCRVEMELALVTGMRGLRLPMQALAICTSVTPVTSVTLDNKSSTDNADIPTNGEDKTSHVTVAMPARGQVMDTPAPGAKFPRSQSVTVGHRKPLSGGEEEGHLGLTPCVEKPTCLTVTVPAADYSKSRGEDSGNLELESGHKETVEESGDGLRRAENFDDNDHVKEAGKEDERASLAESEEEEEEKEKHEARQQRCQAASAPALDIKINLNTNSASEDADDILDKEDDSAGFCAVSSYKTFQEAGVEDTDESHDVQCDDAVTNSNERSANDALVQAPTGVLKQGAEVDILGSLSNDTQTEENTFKSS